MAAANSPTRSPVLYAMGLLGGGALPVPARHSNLLGHLAHKTHLAQIRCDFVIVPAGVDEAVSSTPQIHDWHCDVEKVKTMFKSTMHDHSCLWRDELGL